MILWTLTESFSLLRYIRNLFALSFNVFLRKGIDSSCHAVSESFGSYLKMFSPVGQVISGADFDDSAFIKDCHAVAGPFNLGELVRI